MLVEAALNGSRDAREAIYRRHGPRLLSLATRLLGSEEGGEDVLHDAFLAAFKTLHRLREPQKLRNWLSQILVNRVRSVLRRERLRAQIGLSTVVSVERYVPPEGFESDGILARRDISRVLNQLPADVRLVWWLQRVERYTVSEVAQLTQSTVDKVKKRLVAAEKKLAAYRQGDERLDPRRIG